MSITPYNFVSCSTTTLAILLAAGKLLPGYSGSPVKHNRQSCSPLNHLGYPASLPIKWYGPRDGGATASAEQEKLKYCRYFDQLPMFSAVPGEVSLELLRGGGGGSLLE